MKTLLNLFIIGLSYSAFSQSADLKLWQLYDNDLIVIFPTDTVKIQPIWIIKSSNFNVKNKVSKIKGARVNFDNGNLLITTKKKMYNYTLNNQNDSGSTDLVNGIIRIEDKIILRLLLDLNKKNKEILVEKFNKLPFCIQNNTQVECNCAGGEGAIKCECAKKDKNQDWFLKVYCASGYYACCYDSLTL